MEDKIKNLIEEYVGNELGFGARRIMATVDLEIMWNRCNEKQRQEMEVNLRREVAKN